MNGWWGRILRIDLSAGQWTVEHPDMGVYARWIGGRGLAGSYLWDQATRPWNDPEMPCCYLPAPW